MDERTLEFLRLCDIAIHAAEDTIRSIDTGTLDVNLRQDAVETLQVLRTLRDRTVNGTLRRPSGGAGLGMSRAVGEWAEGTDLMRSVRAVENYYMDMM